MSEEPWIPWAGGECPVAAGTLVDVRHRDEQEFYDHPALAPNGPWQGPRFVGGASNWDHDGGRGDIVAYRICRDTASPSPSEVVEQAGKEG